MYKLMLVDDEAGIRDRLLETIDFPAEGFLPVGTAANGLEALQLAEELQPDLVVTDIRMPILDGLAMARRMRDVLPTVQFIVLTGYDDYEYTRQAIQLRAMDFLLKPVTKDAFLQTLREVRTRMDEAHRQYVDVTRLREHFESSMPLLREMFLSRLLSDEMPAGDAASGAARYGISLSSSRFALGMIRIPPAEEGENPELTTISVQKIAQESLSARGTAYVFRYSGMLALLLPLADDTDDTFWQALSFVEEMRKVVAHHLGRPILVGMAAPCPSVRLLRDAARQAVSALDQSSLADSGAVILITDIEPGSGGALVVNRQLLRELSNALKLGHTDKAREALHTLLWHPYAVGASVRDYRAYLVEILLAFMHTAYDMKLEIDLFTGERDGIAECLIRHPNPTYAERELSQLSDTIAGMTVQHREHSMRQYAKTAQDLIAQRYAQADFTTDEVCRRLHISASYLSQLFKQETGQAPHQYLMQLRMDRAMTLLVSSNLTISQIVEAVGMVDPSYFSYAFKRHFGLSPSQARRSRAKGP